MGSRLRLVMGAILSLFCFVAFAAPRVIIDPKGEGVEFRRWLTSSTSELVGQIDNTSGGGFKFNLGATFVSGVGTPAARNIVAPSANALVFNGTAYLDTNGLGLDYASNATANTYLNFVGYQAGVTQFRNTIIGDGKAGALATFSGSTGTITLAKPVTVNSAGTGTLYVGPTATGALYSYTGSALQVRTLTAGEPINFIVSGSTQASVSNTAITLYKPVTVNTESGEARINVNGSPDTALSRIEFQESGGSEAALRYYNSNYVTSTLRSTMWISTNNRTVNVGNLSISATPWASFSPTAATINRKTTINQGGSGILFDEDSDDAIIGLDGANGDFAGSDYGIIRHQNDTPGTAATAALSLQPAPGVNGATFTGSGGSYFGVSGSTSNSMTHRFYVPESTSALNYSTTLRFIELGATGTSGRTLIHGTNPATSGLEIFATSPDTAPSGDMRFVVSKNTGVDYDTISSSAFAFVWARYGTNLATVARDGTWNWGVPTGTGARIGHQVNVAGDTAFGGLVVKGNSTPNASGEGIGIVVNNGTQEVTNMGDYHNGTNRCGYWSVRDGSSNAMFYMWIYAGVLRGSTTLTATCSSGGSPL